ncbi:MAG TPA: cobalamin-dependent protein [Candidatus Goldiibacteriota bacterium]|jgi:methanogenic corrinoid protein MtbC1|nr:cobalamin-dependent protein [Candidatus Goldiibacteriota bacterium]
MITDTIYKNFLNGLLAGDRKACSEITKELINSSISIKELYTGLFQAAMYEIGEMWEYDKITPAVEHLATGITEYCMSLAYPLIFGAAHRDKTAIISCLVNEYHQIGARMVADFFELHGWHGYFLGANTPVKSLLDMIKDRKPDIVALSISLYSNIPALIKVIDEIRSDFPEIRIIAGGLGLKNENGIFTGKYTGVSAVKDLDSLERLLDEY